MGQIPPIGVDLSQATKIAELAAREAGKYLIGKLGKARIEYQKAPRDNMLDVDLEAEQIILGILRQHFPEYGILSEEAGAEREDQPYYWIVDPLDGSANFEHGSSIFTISIALVIHQLTTVGIVYLPVSDEMFTAIRRQGATLNGQPIRPSQRGRVEEAIIHVGEFERFGSEVSREQIKELTIVANHASRIRILGTSCMDLAWVACGRADAFIMHGGHPWDVKAGRVILEEASGKISSHQYHSGSVLTLYTNGLIHQELSALLGINSSS
jgi:myo-inositol-1(or 4)-monophosphatase